MSDNNKNPITVEGVSGKIELKVRRVHKKKPEAGLKEAPLKENTLVAPVEPKVATKETTSEASEAIKKPVSEPKPSTKEATPKKENSKEKAKEPKVETKEEPKVEESIKTSRKTKEVNDTNKDKASTKEEPKKVKESSKEKKPVVADKPSKPQTEEKVPTKEIKKEAPKDAKKETPVASSEEEKSAKKPEAVSPKKEQPKPVVDKNKISSAVVQMPETIRTSTVINNNRGGYSGGQRNGYRGGGNSFGNNRQGSNGRPPFNGSRPQGGGFRKDQGDQGFSKDKDDDQKPQYKAKPKPKSSDSAIEEVKKSRTNYAEKSLFDKKHNSDNDRNKEKSASSFDKRNKNSNSKFTGKVSEYGDYDDYSYGKRKKKKSQAVREVPEQVITDIGIPAFITVKEFADGIGKKSGDIIKELMKLGILATINQELDFDTACLIADAFGINATLLEEKTEEDILIDDEDDNLITEGLTSRPPVVVVMGHVDHGKTSLLDKIRSTSVVTGEAGGITQHIGAYTVRAKGRQITFLDTPGHEAFTTMRARGANFTDIAILVVAADDGVMPQTIESINHAKAAGTEIIVAINKIDKPGANIDKVKQELTNYELIAEEWGGSTIMVPVSAKQGTGIDELLENVLLVADVLELKADPTRQAKGAVVEAKLDKSRGPVATVLVQRGTLKQGDSVVCGAMIGNVRAMKDDKGKDIKKAGPSTPVEITGLPEVPEAGEMLFAVTDEKMARQLVEKRKIKLREKQLHKSSKMSLENLAQSIAEGEVKELNLIVKADVQGSVEAVTQYVEKLSNEEVRVKVIHGAAGAINESDIMLADVSNAIIIGFNVRPNSIISDKAKECGVDIKLYSVIYSAYEDIEKAMKGLLAPTFEEVVLGHVEIREIFKISGVGTIGGSYVLDGKITRKSEVRVLREDIVIYTGKLASLQRMKDAVKEVNAGYECGLSIEKYNDIKIGDIIEAFENVEVERG